ncbi:TPA: hypothetical protein DDZ75_02845 [Patescibacteria group bacterium]|nr:hypothetical protein [Patescibacteria group bacterium]
MLMEALSWLFVLWLLWVFSGGPSRIEESKKPFLKPPSPLNTGAVYGILPETNTPVFDFKKDIRVGGGIDYSNVSLSSPINQETGQRIIEIRATSNSKKSLNITGWSVKGIMDKKPRVIGRGSQIFYQGKVNPEQEIILYPGEKAIILAGDSPVGASFKVNKCTGYLGQFQVFVPSFLQNCPHVGLDATVGITDGICSQFIRSIPRCNAFIHDYPMNITSECKELVEANLTHNSCVANHIKDSDFYKGEWRVYLGGSDSFGSKDGDIVTIYDRDGNKIDSIIL